MAKTDDSAKQVLGCEVTQQMCDQACKEGMTTIFDRAADMKPCPIGAEGSCCKHCAMGPCRVRDAQEGRRAPEGRPLRRNS